MHFSSVALAFHFFGAPTGVRKNALAEAAADTCAHQQNGCGAPTDVMNRWLSPSALASERLGPPAGWRALLSSGTRKEPITPVAPVRNPCILQLLISGARYAARSDNGDAFPPFYRQPALSCRAAASAVSSGRVLKAIAAFGAALWMMFTTISNNARLLGGSLRPPPITTQS
jgi:hypothetical protein